MREIANGTYGAIWISSEPNQWPDNEIERVLSYTLPAEASSAGSPIYAGLKYVRWFGPEVYVVLGASYTPNQARFLTVEVVVPKVVDPISEDAGEYEAQLNEDTTQIIFDEATKTIPRCPTFKSGVLRFDKMKTHPTDWHPYYWKRGTRIVLGLLGLADFETRSDEQIIAELEGYLRAVSDS